MKTENGEENFFTSHSQPIRHRLYAISLIVECHGTLNSGFWKKNPQRPAIYIKTPHQVVSWDFDPNVKRKFVIVFSENFIAEHTSLGNLIFDFPFFQIDKAIPFELADGDFATLLHVFENIGHIYHRSSEEQLNIIAGYVNILLLHIRELYPKYAALDQPLADAIGIANDNVVSRFFALIKQETLYTADNGRDYSVAFFAERLSIHPNHLSTLLKKQTGRTAQEHIHHALLGAAKTLLQQTDLTMKEVAYRLGFKDPAHFSNFFKKLEKVTPLQYRTSNRR